MHRHQLTLLQDIIRIGNVRYITTLIMLQVKLKVLTMLDALLHMNLLSLSKLKLLLLIILILYTKCIICFSHLIMHTISLIRNYTYLRDQRN